MARNTPPPMPQGAPHPTHGQQQPVPGQQQFRRHPEQQAPYPPIEQVRAPGRLGDGNAGFGRVLLSEWTKLRTVRSTVWTLLVMVVLILGLGVLLGAVADPKAKDDYVSISLIGVMIAQIAAATLGVLTIAAEYTTGMIRTTLTAYPRRIQVLVAKGVVFAGLILVVSLVANTLAAVIGDAMLTSRIGDSAAENSDFFRSVVGSSLYLAVIGLFGLGLGALLRHSAGAITALLGAILLPMIIGPMLPSGGDKVMQYSPMFALIKLIDGGGDTGGPGPWASLLLITVYAGIVLIAGGVRLKTRDV